MNQRRRSALPSSRGTGGRFAVSDGFRALVLDHLDALPELTARPMFGGIGLYSQSVFFGIVAADVLFFKVDGESRGDYERRGAEPFKPFPDRSASQHYYAVPSGVLENPRDLVEWARRAVRAAASSESGRSRKTRR